MPKVEVKANKILSCNNKCSHYLALCIQMKSDYTRLSLSYRCCKRRTCKVIMEQQQQQQI